MEVKQRRANLMRGMNRIAKGGKEITGLLCFPQKGGKRKRVLALERDQRTRGRTAGNSSRKRERRDASFFPIHRPTF